MRGDIIIGIPVSNVHDRDLLTKLGRKHSYELDQLHLLLKFARNTV
jgi:hypothetical protein